MLTFTRLVYFTIRTFLETPILFRPIGNPIPAENPLLCASLAQSKKEAATNITELSTSFIFSNGSLCQPGQTSPIKSLFTGLEIPGPDDDQIFSLPLEKRPKGLINATTRANACQRIRHSQDISLICLCSRHDGQISPCSICPGLLLFSWSTTSSYMGDVLRMSYTLTSISP